LVNTREIVVKSVKSVYRLIDTHAHLEEIENLEKVITEAKSADIIAIIAVGSDYQSNQKVLDLAQTYKDFVYPAIGLHPCNLRDAEIDRTLEFIEAHIGEAVGIGEVGLDYHKKVRAVAEKDLQKRVFREILTMARKHRKPVSIHSRYAWRDALTLVEEAQLEKAVFHWYTGTSSVLRDIVSQGYFISATPAVEYHEEHRRAVKGIPLDRLLLETDSPVVYRRGSEFEYEAKPVDVIRALKGTAGLKGMSEAQIAEVTTNNALKFYGLQG
jgi:TatD DNase family protein